MFVICQCSIFGWFLIDCGWIRILIWMDLLSMGRQPSRDWDLFICFYVGSHRLQSKWVLGSHEWVHTSGLVPCCWVFFAAPNTHFVALETTRLLLQVGRVSKPRQQQSWVPFLEGSLITSSCLKSLAQEKFTGPHHLFWLQKSFIFWEGHRDVDTCFRRVRFTLTPNLQPHCARFALFLACILLCSGHTSANQHLYCGLQKVVTRFHIALCVARP